MASAQTAVANRSTRRVDPARLRDLGCAALFLLLGLAFVHCAGVQTDEAMFAAPLFREWRFFSIPFGHKAIPLMTMPYNGTLKTWLYAPLLLLWRPGAGLIRVPTILIGAATVLLFGVLVQRLMGSRAAWIACLLLATDTAFLLTTTFDWGPVVLQHFLLVAAMFLAVRWFETNRARLLAAAGFCCGLALWDKAVFVWTFSGLLAGCLLFLPDLRRRLSWRAAAAAAAALCLGALPLIFYNLAGEPKWGTIRLSNPNAGSDLTLPEFTKKFNALISTWNGSALFGLVNENDVPQPNATPRSAVQRVSFRLRALAGEHRRNFLMPAFIAALLLLPLLWRTRARQPMCFGLIAMAFAWVHMALAGGGGSPHHAVLLWPLPHLLVAAGFAEASILSRFGKWVLTAVVVFLVATNLLLTNQYFYQFSHDGANDKWSDAIYPLAADLKQSQASEVLFNDWGLLDSLCVLDQNKPAVRAVDDPFLDPHRPPEQKQDALKTLADANAIWVRHTPGHEIVPGVNDRLWSDARRAGFEPVLLKDYFDSKGRAIFQTFRFKPSR